MEGWQDDFWINIGLEDLVRDNYNKIGKVNYILIISV